MIDDGITTLCVTDEQLAHRVAFAFLGVRRAPTAAAPRPPNLTLIAIRLSRIASGAASG